MPPKVPTKKFTCSISCNLAHWKKFRALCVRDGISASHCFESFVQTFLLSMKAGDDLRVELRKMLGLYSEHKQQNYEVDSEAFHGMRHE